MRGDATKSLDRRRDNFLRRAKEIHGDKFDYSKVEFVRAKSPVIIGCPVHGYQSMIPDKHLTNKYGCGPCWQDYRSSGALVGKVAPRPPREPMPRPRQLRLPPNTIPKEKFIEKIEGKVPPGITIKIERYFSLHEGEVRITCSEHGDSIRKAIALWHPKIKYFCLECKYSDQTKLKTKTFDSFLKAARDIHEDKYQYHEEDYVDRKTAIRVECGKHGVFLKKPQKILLGQGCPECTQDRLRREGKLPGGYSDEFFQRHPDKIDSPAHIYYLKIGDVYKIGITAVDPKNRFKAMKSKAKCEVEVLQLVEAMLFNAYTIEQEILRDFSASRVFLPWSTELFNTNVLSEGELQERVNELEKQVL